MVVVYRRILPRGMLILFNIANVMNRATGTIRGTISQLGPGMIALKGLVRQGIILSFKEGSSKSNTSSARRRAVVYGYLLEVLLRNQ